MSKDQMKNKKYFYEDRELNEKELLNELERASRVSRVKKTIEMLEGGETALDVGCNAGFMTVMIAEKYKKVIGIDVLHNNIEIAKNLFSKPNIKYITMNALNITSNFEEEMFDCIVITEVLEHVANPNLLIQNCYQLLKPKGILIVSTPNAYSLKAFMDYITSRNLTHKIKQLESQKMGIGTQIDHIFNWDIFTLARLFIINRFKVKDFNFAGAYWPNIIKWIPEDLLGIKLAEPKWLLSILGRFAYQIILKLSKF